MSAATYNLTIPRGADFGFSLRILDINEDVVTGTLAGHKAEIREAFKKPLAASFTITQVNGTLFFSLTKEQTLALDVNKKYQWDFFFEETSGTVDKLLGGSVAVEPNITHL